MRAFPDGSAISTIVQSRIAGDAVRKLFN